MKHIESPYRTDGYDWTYCSQTVDEVWEVATLAEYYAVPDAAYCQECLNAQAVEDDISKMCPRCLEHSQVYIMEVTLGGTMFCRGCLTREISELDA